MGRCPAHTLPPALSGSCVTARQPVVAAVLHRRRRVAAGLAVTHANKTMPSFTMGASIRIEDTRLVGGLTAGRVLVLVYAIVMVFVHTEYFEMLPITPVSQGGMVASTLEYSRGGACARAQNAHTQNECTPNARAHKRVRK